MAVGSVAFAATLVCGGLLTKARQTQTSLHNTTVSWQDLKSPHPIQAGDDTYAFCFDTIALQRATPPIHTFTPLAFI